MSDDAIVRLTNLLLLDMAHGRFDCMRLRIEGEPPLERFENGEWRAIENVPKLRPEERQQMMNRLRLMGDVDDKTWALGGWLRLFEDNAGMSEFDVSFARTESAATLLVTRLEKMFGWYTSGDAARRAFGLVARAEAASTREEVQARAREAAGALPETDGQYARLLVRAASACGAVGLHDDVIAQLDGAHARTEDARTRVDIEFALGYAHEESARIDDAITHYTRAIALAETMPAPCLHAVLPLTSLGEALALREDLARADEHIARAEKIVETTFGVASVFSVLSRIARVTLARRTDAARAEALATEGLRLATVFDLQYQGDRFRQELAELALARGDADAATTHVRAILREESLAPSRARAYVVLARAHRDGKEALAALRSASALVSTLAATHPLRVEVERELAQLTAATPYR